MNKTLRNLALVALVAAPFSAFADVKGAGTEADPYQIATAEDLCGAYLLVQKNKVGVTYFVQTADIDMAGVTEEYHAVNGGNGVYTSAINYDGKNHVIKNFKPVANADDADASNYYNSSVFGVMTGTLKNLGIVDADINSSNKLGYGIIGGYAGHSAAAAIAPVTKIENVYVTGSIKSEGSSYLGGMFGTTGSDVEVNNCFAIVDIDSKNTYSAGICGRLDHTLTLTGVYVAGTVNSTTALVASARTGKAPAVNGMDFVVFNTGSDIVYGSNIPTASIDITATMANTAADKADGIAEVQEWEAFSATENVNGYPALASFSGAATPGVKGAGTEADPYQIATVEDLCEAWTLTKAGEMVYFVQTADIDMTGVTEWHAFVGFDNVTYSSQVNYDGQNHIIKNFTSPNETFVKEKNNCYNGSIFGVLNGVVKNLGIVDCNINTPQGGGAIGGYAGHGTGTSATIENVYVTGSLKGTNYLGGLVGTNANDLIIRNCFVNATVESTGSVAGIVGRLRSFDGNEFENVYAAGTVKGENGALFVSSDKTGVVAAGINLIAFNTGVADATKGTADLDVEVATEATKAQLIAEVQEWDAFSATKFIKGYPILESFEAYGEETSGIFDAIVEDGSDAPAVYYNLQGVQVNNPENGIFIVRRGNKVTKEVIR